MVQRIKTWLAAGIEVRIVTARVCVYGDDDPRKDVSERQAIEQRVTIMAWTKEHIGTELQVTNMKDYDMLELWDDRAVQVVKNTGLTLSEHALRQMVLKLGEPHHIHKYQEPLSEDSLAPPGMVTTLICYQPDCYNGETRLDKRLYPPDLIGPKLQVVP